MKKFILCLLVVIGFSFATDAQTVTKKTVKSSTTVQQNPAMVKKKTMTKTMDKEMTKTKTGVVLKKDGTPDKRYKKSKVLKKDGTPDMRYKVNQKVEVKKQ